MKPAALVTVIFLIAVGLIHVVRIVLGVPVTAGEVEVPIWASVVAAIATGALAVWLCLEQRGR